MRTLDVTKTGLEVCSTWLKTRSMHWVEIKSVADEVKSYPIYIYNDVAYQFVCPLVEDPGFPRVGAPIPEGERVNLLFVIIFAENCSCSTSANILGCQIFLLKIQIDA